MSGRLQEKLGWALRGGLCALLVGAQPRDVNVGRARGGFVGALVRNELGVAVLAVPIVSLALRLRAIPLALHLARARAEVAAAVPHKAVDATHFEVDCEGESDGGISSRSQRDG